MPLPQCFQKCIKPLFMLTFYILQGSICGSYFISVKIFILHRLRNKVVHFILISLLQIFHDCLILYSIDTHFDASPTDTF